MYQIASLSRRISALFIDYLILMMFALLITLISVPLALGLKYLGLINAIIVNFPNTANFLQTVSSLKMDFHFYNIALSATYFTYFLSSTKQASLGQQILHIHVICCNNKKISVKLAFYRTISQHFLIMCSKILTTSSHNYFSNLNQPLNIYTSILYVSLSFSLIILLTIWYLMAIFNDKKQTLHDKMLNTIVVKGSFNK